MKRYLAHGTLRGFTLVELSVSLAVIAVLTVIFMSRYPETAIRLTLVNVAHTTSLLVREAQVRGSAIDSINSSLGGYGVYAALATPGQVTLFGDLVDASVAQPYGIAVGDGLYATTTPSEIKSVSTFPSGYTVSKLCVGTGFPFTCNTSNTPAITSLIISFTRPDPSPNIYINNSNSTNYTAACIELRSSKAPLSGHIRSVRIYNSGLINTAVGRCDNSSS